MCTRQYRYVLLSIRMHVRARARARARTHTHTHTHTKQDTLGTPLCHFLFHSLATGSPTEPGTSLQPAIPRDPSVSASHNTGVTRDYAWLFKCLLGIQTQYLVLSKQVLLSAEQSAQHPIFETGSHVTQAGFELTMQLRCP